MNNPRLNSVLGVVLKGTIYRCEVIGEVIRNNILIKRESDGKIFSVTTGLIAWVNEG